MAVNRDNLMKIVPVPAVKRNPKTSKIVLSLVQTACLLAQEGVSRISASELVERLCRESNTTLTPPEVGQILSELGVRKSILHGKSRFILERAELAEVRQKVARQCEEEMKTLQSRLEEFKRLISQIPGSGGRMEEYPAAGLQAAGTDPLNPRKPASDGQIE